MILDRLFNSRVGIIIISIIWGLGLSTLFTHAYRNKPHYIINGPPIQTTMNDYYNYGSDRCYQYYPMITNCR